jgi:hypothetical protein
MDAVEQPDPARSPEAVAEGERRRDERRPFRGPVRLVIEAQELDAQGTNLSENGTLVTAEGTLRVRVEFERDGKPVVAEGRLVRAQRLSAQQTGLAVEFDGPTG